MSKYADGYDPCRKYRERIAQLKAELAESRELYTVQFNTITDLQDELEQVKAELLTAHCQLEEARKYWLERAAEILVQSNFYTVDEMVQAIRDEIK